MKFYTPIEYVKIDIANQFGLDKETFESRINWVDTHEIDLETLIPSADDKTRPRYIKAVMVYRDAQKDKPIGHLVGLDACSSGPQIMSALMRDPIGAENTNLIGNQRNDLYSKVTETINQLLNTTNSYNRKTVKNATMPFYYGSEAKPKEAFGDRTPELKAFYIAQEKVCPGAAMLRPLLIKAWRPYALEHFYTLADGYNAHVKVTGEAKAKIEIDELDHSTFTYQYKINQGTEKGVALAANVVQAIDGMIVREMNRRCNYNPEQFTRVLSLLKRRINSKSTNGIELSTMQKLWLKTGFMALTHVEKLTWDDVKKFDFEYTRQLINLIERCLERPHFPVIMVHDEFQCHANYVNYVRLTYIELMAEISDSCILETILEQILNKPITITKLSSSIAADILQSEYALS